MLEKPLESSLKILQCTLSSTLSHLKHPWELLPLDGVKLFVKSTIRGLKTSLILLFPPCKTPIVGKTSYPTSSTEIGLLPVVRV
jgi:hypothetical protein